MERWVSMSDRHDKDGKCPRGSFPYTIKSGDTLYLLAQRYNTTVEAIMRLNPGIDPKNLQIGQVICIPSEKPMPPCQDGFYYTIRQGDTFYKLSQQFGVSVEDLMRANPGVDPNNLQIGQVICIPHKVSPIPPCPNGFYYTIKTGDTIYGLSQRFNVSVQEILYANPGIDPNNLQIGMQICIPRRMPDYSLPPCPNGFYYTIRPGDTIFMIGQKFNVPAQEIIHANPGIDPNNLQIGQVICIPRKCVVFCF